MNIIQLKPNPALLQQFQQCWRKGDKIKREIIGDIDNNWDIVNSKDLINYNVALVYELIPGVHLIPMYMWNRERVNEIDDDFLLIKFFMEF